MYKKIERKVKIYKIFLSKNILKTENMWKKRKKYKARKASNRVGENMGTIASWLRDSRNLAFEKNPQHEPLIVTTGHYIGAVAEKEILGVAVKAPFGSGKTFGIGLKSYHDSRLNKSFMDDSRVIVIRARELIDSEENRAQAGIKKHVMFHELVRDSKNVMCGGILVSTLRFVTERYHDLCISNKDHACYTSLSANEIEAIKNILSDMYSVKQVPRVDYLADLLDRIKREALRKRNLVFILDEVEGFLQALSVKASDVVYSNLAAMGKLQDHGLWGMKLVMLIQNKVIDDDWSSMVDSIKKGIPYVSEVFKGAIQSTGTSSVYVCPATRERLDVSALMGRVKLSSIEYYGGREYAEYLRLAFKRISEHSSASQERFITNDSIVSVASQFASSLEDLTVFENVEKRLAFLGSIAPRVSFDYMDELIENMLKTGSSDLLEALDRALVDVANMWSKFDDIRRFYARIVLKKMPVKKRPGGKNINIYSMIGSSDYPNIVETLSRDLYARLLDEEGLGSCILFSKTSRYHSNYAGTVSCTQKNLAFSGLLVLRATSSRPSGAAGGEKFVKQLSTRISEMLTAELAQPAGAFNRHVIVGLMLLPEDTPSAAVLTIDRLFMTVIDRITDELKRKYGKRIPVFSVGMVHQIKDEDFIIIANKALEREAGVSMITQFVEERYRDIVAELVGRIRSNPRFRVMQIA